MRALVIGRGSMGRRRIRDLKRIGLEVTSWDAADGCDLFGWKGTDLTIISTPPNTKTTYTEIAGRYGACSFSEADIEPTGARFPSCTPLRFAPRPPR